MPPKAKPPRLYLRKRDGRSPVYVILDRSHEECTGYGPNDPQAAEECLQSYIASKWAPPTERRARSLCLAEIISTYAAEHLPSLAQPVKEAGFLSRILDWWGEKPVAAIKGHTCRAYAAHRAGQRSEEHTSELQSH